MRIQFNYALVLTGIGIGLLALTSCKSMRFERNRANELRGLKDQSALSIMNFDKPFDFDEPGRFHFKYWIVKTNKFFFVKDESHQALQIISKNSASMLVRYTDYKLAIYPVIEWWWKVTQAINSSVSELSLAGDDHPARLFISFRHKGQPVKFLEIIWASQAKVRRILHVEGLTNADGRPFPHYVVESGLANVGRWIQESVDLKSIYQQVWPKDNISEVRVTGVGVTADSDDTNTASNSFFAEIKALKGATTRNQSLVPKTTK